MLERAKGTGQTTESECRKGIGDFIRSLSYVSVVCFVPTGRPQRIEAADVNPR